MQKIAYIILALLFSTMAQAERWLSVDYCSDYYLHKFVDKAHIVSLSPVLYDSNFSHITSADKDDIAQYYPSLERIISLAPQKILVSDVTPSSLTDMLKAYDMDIVEIPYATAWADIKANNIWFGNLVQNAQQAATLNAKIDAALMKIPEARNKTAMIVGSGDFIIHSGTHYDLLLELLGYNQYDEKQQYYGKLQREQLIRKPVDLFIRLKSMNMELSQLSDLQGFDFLDHLPTPPTQVVLPLSYGLCANDQLIDARDYIQEQLK